MFKDPNVQAEVKKMQEGGGLPDNNPKKKQKLMKVNKNLFYYSMEYKNYIIKSSIVNRINLIS